MLTDLERRDTAIQTRSDDSIRDDVQFELKWDPKIGSSSDIAVAAKEGVVTLSGFVQAIGTKMQPRRQPSASNGVRGVANDIEVN